MFFLYLANFYRELANIRNSWHLDNAMKCYTMFYDLLQEQIVSGELLNSKYGASLLFYVQYFISQIKNTNSELYELLNKSLSKIKSALSENFSKENVGDPFVLGLICELQEGGNFDYGKYMGRTENRSAGQILIHIGRGFKEKFIDLYDIKINDVFELVSDYVNKLNNDPNTLKSVKEKAKTALEVIDLAKTQQIYVTYIEAK